MRTIYGSRLKGKTNRNVDDALLKSTGSQPSERDSLLKVSPSTFARRSEKKAQGSMNKGDGEVSKSGEEEPEDRRNEPRWMF